MKPDSTSLDRLHDIVVPDAVPWWPLAPGWYVVGLALILVITWLSLRFIQKRQRDRFVREALIELENIKPSQLPALVKRVALHAYPREQVASLSGKNWLSFLDQTGNTVAFTESVGQQLLDLSYTPTEPTNSEFPELKKTIRTWILNLKPSLTINQPS